MTRIEKTERFFAIPKYAGQTANSINAAFFSEGIATWDDYNSKYPEDEWMEEFGPHARVWRVCNEENERFDAEMVGGWRDTADVLLVFAGLFSAVVTTFVVQTSTALQPDYSQISASLLTELVALQRAAITNGNIEKSSLTFDTQFTPSRSDIWVNGLWFTSLALSLSAALMAGLIKQWIQHYVSNVSGTPKHKACVRQFRYAGIGKWRLRLIVELLPVLMNTALLLFFVGMVLFLRVLEGSIAWVIATITIVAYSAYLCSSLLPLFYPDCPFNTSLSYMLKFFWLRLDNLRIAVVSIVRELLKSMMKRVSNSAEYAMQDLGDKDDEGEYNDAVIRHAEPWKQSDSEAATRLGDRLAMDAITGLVGRSSNPTVHSVALQSLSGQLRKSSEALSPEFTTPLERHFMSCFELDVKGGERRYMLKSGFAPVAERLSRALVNASSGLQSKTLSCLLDFLRTVSLEIEPDGLSVYYGFNTESVYCRIALLIYYEGIASSNSVHLCSPTLDDWLRHIISIEGSLPDSLRNYPWIYEQIINYTNSFHIKQLWTLEERTEHLLMLATRLSPDQYPSLKDEIILRCLHNLYCTSLNKPGLNSFIPEIGICFFELLPHVVPRLLIMNSERTELLDDWLTFFTRMLCPKLFKLKFTFHTMWSDKPYHLPHDHLRVFESYPFLQLLENRLKDVVCNKPTYPRLLSESVSIVTSLIELDLIATDSVVTSRRYRLLFDFLVTHPSSSFLPSDPNSEYVQSIRTQAIFWFKTNPACAALTFRDAILDFHRHDYAHHVSCAHTVEDRSLSSNLLTSIFELGIDYLASDNSLVLGITKLSPRQFLFPLMDCLLPETPVYTDTLPPYESSLEFALKLHDACTRNRDICNPKLLKFVLASGNLSSSPQKIIFVQSQVLHFPFSSLWQVYGEVSTWRTDTGVRIPSAERLSIFLGFACDAASHVLSQIEYHQSKAAIELKGDQRNFKLIRQTFEYLLKFSARGTKVENTELMDTLFIFDVRSDVLGSDWVLHLLDRVLEQQPASVPEALTRRDHAERALVKTRDRVGRQTADTACPFKSQ